MISNVNLNASAHMQNVNKLPDEKLHNESNSVAAVEPVKNDVNDTAVVDVFTVSFWERGVPKADEPKGEAATSVDITVDGGIYLDTSKN